MARMLLFFILTLSFLISKEVSNSLMLSGHEFIMATESYNLYGSKGNVVRFYQKVPNAKIKPLLSFTLDETTGGCRITSVEDGSYEVSGSKITFYTLWDRRNNADEPYGARIQTYIIEENGEFKLLSSKIYIETEPKRRADQSAMQYLFQPPVTPRQKEALRRYVESAEQRFKGRFVFGKEAQSLIKEVNEALHRKMQKRWH